MLGAIDRNLKPWLDRGLRNSTMGRGVCIPLLFMNVPVKCAEGGNPACGPPGMSI
ncbi:hypothetical protein M413DRAFT_449540, partial [Hebeloma cylindrosporum]